MAVEATVVVLEAEASTEAAGFAAVVSAGVELDMAATMAVMAMDTGILTDTAVITTTKVVATWFASA